MINVVIKKIDEDHINENYDIIIENIYSERRKRIESLKNKKAQYASITAGLMLQDIIYRECGIEPADLKFLAGDNGKPYLQGDSTFKFNISHSGEYVVVAHGTCELGVDIEEIRSMKTIDEAVVKKCFTDDEQQYINISANEDRESRFIKLWTMKESCVKLTGKGISIPLNSFSVLDDNCNRNGGKVNFYVEKINNYYLSLCTFDTEHVNIIQI